MIDPQTAETLNKALDLAKQGVVAAFETVKQYAPYVWAMARRQTQIEGYELLFGAFLAFILMVSMLHITRKYWNKDPVAILALVFGVGGSLALFVSCTINAIDFIGNPDWWTMMKILELVKK